MMQRVSLFPLGILRKFQNLYHGDTTLAPHCVWCSAGKTLRRTPCLGVSVVQKILLLLLFLFIPSTVVFASSLNTTRINVLISDSEGQPLANVRVSLDLYLYEVITADQTELRGAYSDECNTDQYGMCTIVIGETQNYLLRGTLDLGQYGIRNLEWHGGVLDVPIRIEQAHDIQFNHATIYGVLMFLFGLLGVIVQRQGAHA